jgi:hypothetical protein
MHTLNWLEGNIDMDPLWLGSGDFPYQLQWNSPCINAGTPMFEEGMQPPYIKLEDDKIVLYKIDGDTLHLPAHDLAGNPRIRGGRIDMGAYEFQDTVNLIRNNPWQQQDNKLHIYPNPFSAHTFISFKTKTPGDILAVVSDMNGRHVKTLMDARTSGGEYSITWKGDDYLTNPRCLKSAPISGFLPRKFTYISMASPVPPRSRMLLRNDWAMV